MTNVNGYRDGELSSTALMQHMLEEAHVVGQGEGKKVAWQAGHETQSQAMSRIHNEPTNVAGEVLGGAAEHIVKHEATRGLKAIATSALEGLTTLTAGSASAKLGLGKLALAAAPELAGGVLATAAVAELVHACNQGDELKAKSDVDTLDVAVTNLIALDAGFADAERAKYPNINAQAVTRLFKAPGGPMTELGKQHLPELQAAADAGAKAAFEAMRCGGREGFASVHPDLAKRLQSDIAFNKGFESVMWCARQPDREARLNAIQAGIDARNVEPPAMVPVRG